MATEFTGTGDPARSMALLWRAPAGNGSRPGPRSSLDVDRIVSSAVRLADSEGLAALSMRRVAAEIGVAAMTLYTHVPGKSELVDLMHDAVLGEVYPAPPAGDWRARVAAAAPADWELFLRRPRSARDGTGQPNPGLLPLRK